MTISMCHKVGSIATTSFLDILHADEFRIPMALLDHLNIISSSLILNPLLEHGVSDLTRAVSYNYICDNVD